MLSVESGFCYVASHRPLLHAAFTSVLVSGSKAQRYPSALVHAQYVLVIAESGEVWSSSVVLARTGPLWGADTNCEGARSRMNPVSTWGFEYAEEGQTLTRLGRPTSLSFGGTFLGPQSW